MSPHLARQRQSILALLCIQVCCWLAALAYYLLTPGLRPGAPVVLALTALVIAALLLYLRGHSLARHLSVIALAAGVALLLPDPLLLGDSFPISFFLPPVYALVLAGPGWIIGSAVLVYLAFLLRTGGAGVFSDPAAIIGTLMLVGGMALARRITDLSLARAEEQARLLAEERKLLAERVAERTLDLRLANDELVRASQLKDAFLANVSHELRTPLNLILGNIGLLQEGVYGPVAEQQRRPLDTIAESGLQLLNLINDLLDLAKIEAGRLAFAYTEVPVREVCDGCLVLTRQLAARKGLRVEFAFDPAVEMIQSDPRRLRQILLGLLSNAVKFTPGGRAIGLEVRALQAEVEFVVWDEGVGIAAEDVERLFQPFTQLDQGLARQYEGTGLGLALVRQLVALHHGLVEVVSAPGAGSRFTVRLPQRQRETGRLGGSAPAVRR